MLKESYPDLVYDELSGIIKIEKEDKKRIGCITVCTAGTATTATPLAQELIMVRRAEIPFMFAPYPTDVGTAMTGKADKHLLEIVGKLYEAEGEVMGTRATKEQYEMLKESYPAAGYSTERYLPDGGWHHKAPT